MHTLELWHQMFKDRDIGRLDEILAENCVFLSPIVHRPQEGRELTKFYLTGAFNVFNDSLRCHCFCIRQLFFVTAFMHY